MRSARVHLMAALLITLLLSIPAQAAGDFALIDQHGYFHQLSRYGASRAVVMMVQRNADESSHAAAAILTALRDRHREAPLTFLMLNADEGVTRADVLEAAVDFPVLLDAAQIVALSLGVTHVADVVVLDPRSQRVLYRGALHEARRSR